MPSHSAAAFWSPPWWRAISSPTRAETAAAGGGPEGGPRLEDDEIGVAVRDGVVTLGGWVKSYADKWRAERVASRVKGVKALANDLEVKLPSSSNRTDADIARAAVDALMWNI